MKYNIGEEVFYVEDNVVTCATIDSIHISKEGDTTETFYGFKNVENYLAEESEVFKYQDDAYNQVYYNEVVEDIEKELVDFGNYLLKHRGVTGSDVTDADIKNWVVDYCAKLDKDLIINQGIKDVTKATFYF